MNDTLAAVLTPSGNAAIAVIGVCGPQALPVVQQLFQPARQRREASMNHAELHPSFRWQAGCFYLGTFGAESRDEVVLLVKQIEPVPWLEVHCHGGREVVHLILELLEAQGVQRCPWQEWLRWVTPATLQAEAAIQLAEACTTRTAAILLDQYHGAWERELAALSQLTEPQAGLQQEVLAERLELGRHLTTPWRVVVAGAPNVGKSSLVNAVAGFQRSIISPQPGTTRDLVRTLAALDGWPVELVDTAGLRNESEELEEAGVQLALQAAASADLCLWVVAGSTEPVWPPQELSRCLLVINKIDLPAAWVAPPEAIRVSAKLGEGIPALIEAVVHRLVPHPPPPGAGVPFAAECRQQLAELPSSPTRTRQPAV